MMIRKRGVLFLFLAAGAAFVAMNILIGEQEPPPAPDGPSVLVAKKDISPGAPLSADLATALPWTAGDLPEGALSRPEEAAGRMAAELILAGEPITETKLLPPGVAMTDNPAGRIPPGMRAVSLLLAADAGMPDQIAPGDAVDVLVSSPLSESDGSRISRVLLRGVRVLEAEAASDGRAANAKRRVTLTLRPGDVPPLLAAESERIRLSLRPPISGMASEPGSGAASDMESGSDEAMLFTRWRGPTTQSHLSDAARKRFERLCAGIPPGMRAVSIAVIDEDGICGRLWPGCRVDVLSTHEFVSTIALNRDEAIITDVRKFSKIVMRNLEVLAVDTDFPSADTTGAPPASPRGVTLLANPEDAEALIVLADTSNVRLLLRREDEPAEAGLREREGASADELFGVEEETEVEIIRGMNRQGKRFPAEEAGARPRRRDRSPGGHET